MLSLYLTRHAKSSWDDPRTDDLHRPLNDRGLRDGPLMAQRFVERAEPVDILMSSPAERAITTARMFAKALGLPDDRIRQNKEIYLAPHNALLRIVNLLPKGSTRVMLVGHNPGMSELVEYLGDSDIGEMPTCATVRLDFDLANWADVSMGLGAIRWYDYPKRYAQV
jgi:phosphohistidine phosphatase